MRAGNFHLGSNLTLTINNGVITGSNAKITGNGNVVTGSNAWVKGNNNTVTGSNAWTKGNNNTVTGTGATVYGNDNKVTGINVTVHGNNNNVKGRGIHVTGVGNVTENHDADQGGVIVNNFGMQNVIGAIDANNVINIVDDSSSSSSSNEQQPKKKSRKRDREQEFVQGPVPDELKHDEKEPDESKTCVVCLENKRICIAVPCHHLSYCVKCAREMCFGAAGDQIKETGEVKCAICREAVDSIKRTF